MIDLGALEEGFYSSLLSQFTFICFFSQFLIGAGLVSYLINLFIIYLILKIYSKVSRRPISRKVSNIGVWNDLFDIVSYLGIVYNTIIAVKYTKGLSSITGDEKTKVSDVVSETEYIYRVQFGLLVFKFLFSILVPTLPEWIKLRISREKLTKNRNSKNLSRALSRFKKLFANYEDMFEDEDSADLKYFFKNEERIEKFKTFYKKDDEELQNYHSRNSTVDPFFTIENANKRLL